MDRRLALLVPALVAGACAVDPATAARDRAVTDLEIAVGQHRFDEAEAMARRVLARPDLPPPDRCAAQLSLGRALDGQGRASEALDALAVLGRRCAGEQESSARGLVEVALLAERLGNGAVAERAWSRVVTAFPDDPAAVRAAEAIRNRHVDAGHPDAAMEALRRLYRAVPDRSVSPHLLFLAARLAEQASPPTAASRALAASLYRLVAEAHPSSGVANDALLAGARLALADGRFAEAAASAERLLAQRQWSFLLGSYDLGLYADAAFLRAEAAARAAEPPAAVVGWYDAFARWFPKDPRAPLARLRAARALDAAGDRPGALHRFRALASEAPDTAAGRFAAAVIAGVEPGPEPSP